MGTLRASEIFNDSRFMLVAIESVDFQHTKMHNSCHLYGNIKPIAIIVCGPDKIYSLDMEAKPSPIEQLRQEIPDLDAIITAFNKV